ncbi:MAG TPA: glycosyltransferase [Casimicrobiaceae bacterium]|nr:glycosyltransferase [Casimicrobiaceae bacterium]
MERAFLELERRCAAAPHDAASRRRMLQLFIALGEPEALPGSSLAAPVRSTSLRVAVVTPYCRESLAMLARCHQSVLAQTVPCDHYMVADGYARDEIDRWSVRHIRLDAPCADFGDTPRRVAGEIVREERYDAVAYLDADNAFRPRHVESLLVVHRMHGAPVCHAARTLHRTDGTLMPLLQRGDNEDHVDTSCLLLTQDAFEMLRFWGSYPPALSAIDDRMFWSSIRGRGLHTAFSGALTCRYEASHEGFFAALREPAPPGTRPDVDLAAIGRWFATLAAAERQRLDAHCRFPIENLIASLQA